MKKVHYIDGRNMEVKKAVPKTDMQPKGRNMSSDRGGGCFLWCLSVCRFLSCGWICRLLSYTGGTIGGYSLLLLLLQVPEDDPQKR